MAAQPRYVGSLLANTQPVVKTFAVANGVTVTEGDLVYFASGRITSASVAGARLIGQVLATATGNSGGTVTAPVNVDPNAIYQIVNDNVGTTFAATHVGTYFDMIGATGAQLVDTSTTSATTGQMLCLAYNPDNAGATVGHYKIAEHASSPLGS